MLLSKKMMLTAIAGVLTVGLAVGGGTYALFKSNVANGPNNFTAGTLQISASRDDVPNVGPMFYTNSTDDSVGAMPTGFWAPGDKHTRGLFLENKGTLKAKLKNIGADYSAGSNAADEELFAKQAKVKIWEVKQVDLSGGIVPFTRIDADKFDEVMDYINEGYTAWINDHPNADLNDQETIARLLNAVNAVLLERLNDTSNSTTNRFFKVVRMYNDSLYNLVQGDVNVSSYNITADPGQAALLGFTVELQKRPTAGIDKNALQGKEVQFDFTTSWEQVRNN